MMPDILEMSEIGRYKRGLETATSYATLYYALLDAFEDSIDPELLQADERERLSRIDCRDTAKRYAVGRSILRFLIGRRLDISPAEVKLTYNRFGKPQLRAPTDLHFSVSHSEDLIAIVISNVAIGIDVEMEDNAKIAYDARRCFMTAVELDALGEEEDPLAKSLYIWNAKEAILKASGYGFRLSPFSIQIGSMPYYAQIEFFPRRSKLLVAETFCPSRYRAVCALEPECKLTAATIVMPSKLYSGSPYAFVGLAAATKLNSLIIHQKEVEING